MRPLTPHTDRKPGRSFEDPSRPLGDEIIAHSPPSNVVPEDFRSREKQAEASGHGVAERAKAIAVLRKFEELMVEQNPPVSSERGMLHVLELAAGRVGLTPREYQNYVRGDDELVELERKVLNAARACF
jgi:hypothetical protein